MLRLALQRPHFTLSNVMTYPKRVSGTGSNSAAAAGAATGGACAARPGRPSDPQLPLLLRLLLGRQGMRMAAGAGAGGSPAPPAGTASSDASTDLVAAAAAAAAQRSACMLMQSKAAVKLAAALLPGPLAAARYTLRGEFSVNLVSFSDAANCKCVRPAAAYGCVPDHHHLPGGRRARGVAGSAIWPLPLGRLRTPFPFCRAVHRTHHGFSSGMKYTPAGLQAAGFSRPVPPSGDPP